MAKITVQNTPITILSVDNEDYISLTDSQRWRIIHNPNFKVVEFDHFRMSSERLMKLNQIAIHL